MLLRVITFIDDSQAQEVVSVTCMSYGGEGSWCRRPPPAPPMAAADPKPIYGGPGAGGASVAARPAPCHPPGDYRDQARYSRHLPVCGGRRAPRRFVQLPLGLMFR